VRVPLVTGALDVEESVGTGAVSRQLVERLSERMLLLGVSTRIGILVALRGGDATCSPSPTG